jgi:hypothetical protein
MDAVRQLTHALQIPEINLEMDDGGIGDGESLLGSQGLEGVPAGHHHMPTAIGEGLGGK